MVKLLLLMRSTTYILVFCENRVTLFEFKLNRPLVPVIRQILSATTTFLRTGCFKVPVFKMFNVVKQHKKLVFLNNYLMRLKNQRCITTTRPFTFNYPPQTRLSRAKHGRSLLVGTDQFRFILSRNKSKQKKTAKYNEEDSSDEEDELEIEGEDDLNEEEKNLKTFIVKSLRVDGVLKTALGISRKKVETYFYENKIRVNGKILTKKSENVDVNDEVDLIIGFVKNSSKHLNINRIKILKIESNPDSDNKIIKVVRDKSLRINNYANGNSWKHPEDENL